MKKMMSLVFTLTLLLAIAFPAHAVEDLILIGGEDYVEPYDDSTDWGEPNYDWISPLGEDEEDWSWEKYEAEQAAARKIAIDAKKIELGGVPGELGVMVNGKYLTYENMPRADDGRIYVPLDATLEQLGATLPDSLGPITGRVSMGSSSGVMYVQLRALAEALGYTVLWDAQFETAVLIDRAAAIAEIDSRLGILNGVLTKNAALTQDGGVLRGALDLDLTVTLFNTLDGDEKYSIAADMDFQSSQTAADMHVAMDLSELRALVEPLLPLLGGIPEDGTQESALVSNLLGLLGDVSFTLRFDMETGKMYFQIPLLAGFIPGLGAEDWIFMDLGDYLGQLPDWSVQGAYTIGTLVYEMTAMGYDAYYYAYGYSVDETTPVFLHAGIQETADLLTRLLGDDQFVAESGKKTLRLDAEDLTGLFDEMFADLYGYDYGFSPLLKEFSFDLTVNADSTFTLNFVLRPQMNYASLSVADFRIAINLVSAEDEIVMEMEVHYKNTVKVNALLTETWAASSDPVSTEPPAGAKVIDLMQMVMSQEPTMKTFDSATSAALIVE